MSAVRIAAALALLAVGCFALYETVESPRSGAFGPVITHGEGHVVALTYDDGPTAGVTDRVLTVLERERVPATFFVVGRAARRRAALLRRMTSDGDEIENHSETHAHLNTLLPLDIDRQIAVTDDAVFAATGRRTTFLRPPFGARDAAVIEAARARGMQVVLWTAMLDETSPGAAPDALVERLLQPVRDGAIIVLHDGDQGRDDPGGRSYEASLTPLVIGQLRRRGYRFVTLETLLHPRPETGRRIEKT